MVLRVCRAALRDEHDAHDAFQATFLILVHKAASLWVRTVLQLPSGRAAVSHSTTHGGPLGGGSR